MNIKTLIYLLAMTWPFLGLMAQGTRATDSYKQIKTYLNSIRAIDTHDHLWPWEKLRGFVEIAEDGERGMNLYGLWRLSYYTWNNPLTSWQPGMDFDEWWGSAQHDFNNSRAMSFYRYLLPAFTDLYGVDFESLTPEQARQLDQRIRKNYQDPNWIHEVISVRAGIEFMFIDPHWRYGELKQYWPFQVMVLRVQQLLSGFHRSEFEANTLQADEGPISPYDYAESRRLKVDSFEDYLHLVEEIIRDAKQRGAACLKQASAYHRTLQFDSVPTDRAAKAFGRPRSELTAREIKDFEDFVMWRIAELCARYELPLQIHTGHARLQGSNPLLLLDLIEGNPKTKFVLFHGGFPWVEETGAIVSRHTSHVWIDSNWLPTLSYATAKRALHEWLDVVPSNRILWGGDTTHAEGIYGAVETYRRCLAEVLAEKVMRGDLKEKFARRIGRQILRENALELFPQLAERVRPVAP